MTQTEVPLLPPGLFSNGLFRHREGPLARCRLDATAQRLFEPGEQVIVAFDGATRFPRLRNLPMGIFGAAFGQAFASLLIWLRGDSADHGSARFNILVSLGFLSFGVLARVSFWLLGSRAVMVAMTTLGVVECRTDWLNRPRAIRQRGPVEEPEFYEGAGHHVQIGPVDVYVSRATELMLWRRMKRVRPQIPAIYAARGVAWKSPEV